MSENDLEIKGNLVFNATYDLIDIFDKRHIHNVDM